MYASAPWQETGPESPRRFRGATPPGRPGEPEGIARAAFISSG